MAKANDKSNAIHWIWLIEALQEAIKVLGSKRFARRRLKQWMATGELPWICMSLNLLDEKGQEMTWPQLGTAFLALKLFWDATSHWIDWEDNCAGENELGAVQAMGIKVSRERFFTLLLAGSEPSLDDNETGKEAGSKERGRADRKKAGPQLRRVLNALKAIYPPDGKVPSDVSTSVVRGRVADELSVDSRNRGLADPSWETVNRALNRAG